MLRIPLPMFYVAANPDGTWEVVDGLQRLTTIRDFLLGGQKEMPEARQFPLIELEFWGERFNNKTFSQIELDPSNSRIINNILETEMRFTVINPGTPEEVKRNIFKRINTGGMPLTLQEIRHALYQGPATDLLIELVGSTEFKNAIDNSIDDSRMAGRELVLRFLAFHIFEIEVFDGDMDSLLSNTMRTINHLPAITSNDLARIFGKKTVPQLKIENTNSIKDSFVTAMNRSVEFFGDYAFRKGVGGQRRTPVNKALFEAWSKILAELPDDKYIILLQRKVEFLSKYEDLLKQDDFDRAISRDSSSAFGVKERYRSLNELVSKSLEKND
jgi:hypothetical protein